MAIVRQVSINVSPNEVSCRRKQVSACARAKEWIIKCVALLFVIMGKGTKNLKIIFKYICYNQINLLWK